MIASIARRRTFVELRRDGRRARSGSVRLSFLPLDTEHPQVAFAIGRPFGNAVERNRGRRRLRAAFVEAAFPVSPTTNRKSTDSVENVPAGGEASTVSESHAGSNVRNRSGSSREAMLGELQGAFLLSGNRGLLSSPFTDLVRDVDTCLEKLKTTLVS